MRSKTKKSREWMSVFAVFVILGACAVRSSVGPAMLSVQAATSGALIPQSGWSLLSVDSQETVCGNYAAVNSFDGNTATFWHTQFCPTTPGTPHDIQINLGATYNISGFTYLPRQDGCSHGWISQYQFYVSADGVNWGNPVSSGTLNYGSAVTGCPGASVPPAIQVLFPSTSAHYVQLRALSEITGGPYISMAELNLVAGSSTAALSSLALNPTTVTAGTTSQGTVVLSAAAPSSGAVITLSSSNTAAATAPASVSVAAGATSGTFTVSTGSVSAPASSTISASYSGLTVTAPLTVNPAPIVSSLAVNPTSVVGGNSALGTVTLSTAAPASGAVVSLTTSNPVAAAVPANVSIAGGATTASFTVSTSPVASTTAVTSSASYGGATATATLSVQAGAVGTNTPIPQSGWSLLSVDSQETTCGNYAAVNSFDGKPATFWHTQFCPTTPGVPHYIEINLGATYNISGFTYLPRQDGCSHGWISQYQFYVSADGVNWGNAVSSGTLNYGSAVTGCPGASVPPAIQVLFPSTSAHYVKMVGLSEVTGGPYISMAELNVLSNSGAAQSQSSTPAVTALTLNPIGVAGGATSQGKVTLSSAAPSSGIVVTLASSNTAAATVPTSVSIASGTTSATFTVSTSSVSASTSSTISATYAGATMTAPLAVSPAVAELAVVTVTVTTTGQQIPSNFGGISTDFFDGQSTIPNPLFPQLVKNLTFPGQTFNLNLEGDSASPPNNPPTNAQIATYKNLYTALQTLSVDLEYTMPVTMCAASNPATYAEPAVATYLANAPLPGWIGVVIGNEPDGSIGSCSGGSYSGGYSGFLSNWNNFRTNINALSGASALKFVGPSFGGQQPWVYTSSDLNSFVNGEAPYLTYASQHWYTQNGCSGTPTVAAELSAASAKPTDTNYAAYVSNAHTAGTTLRISEMNDIDCGGTSGISNTFAAALWMSDAMFNLASVGTDGVNIFSDEGIYDLMDFPSLSACTINVTSGCNVNPNYYGFQLFQEATQNSAKFLPVSTTTSANVSVWATIDAAGIIRIAVLNKDQTNSGTVAITLAGYGNASLKTLTAASVTATMGVSYGGQTLDGSTDGTMQGTLSTTTVAPTSGVYIFAVAPTSAALLTVAP
jgi:hypothetical protein